MKTARPVRGISANLHTTSNPMVVVPWLWALAVRHRAHVMTLQEVTPRHARVLRLRPRWVLVKHPETQEALYVKRRHSKARRVVRLLDTGWARTRLEGDHPGRALPTALVRGWLTVGSIHLPPGWMSGWGDRRAAGHACLAELEEHLPISGPLYLDGDWNTRPGTVPLAQWRRRLRIVHSAERGCLSQPWVALGRVKGMDHDAHLFEVTP